MKQKDKSKLKSSEHPVQEAIVLAGGFGTRLSSVVNDVPKCLAKVNGIPFLDYVLKYAYKQGVTRFILSVGYKKEMIFDFITSQSYPFEVVYCEEDEPLGTGGAIKKSLTFCHSENILVLNGDTLFEYSLNSVQLSDCSIFLKPMRNFDRYGSVNIDDDSKIISFQEKKKMEEGLINSGAYILNKNAVFKLNLKEKFSFEKDFLEKYILQLHFIGLIQDAYFIDIGIPEDYEKAQIELKYK
jgi:D-glycero-alpha-D-manno-heptose 1-phosphate guanylyltransferase